MTKINRQESAKAMYYASMGDYGIAARTISTCIRSASKKDINELIAMAAACPAIAQHPDFVL